MRIFEGAVRSLVYVGKRPVDPEFRQQSNTNALAAPSLRLFH